MLAMQEVITLYTTGQVGFMGYGDLWGSESTALIFYKSRTLIYGDLWVGRG